MKCPNCNTDVQSQHINIQTDLAQCQSCHNIFKISEAFGNINSDGFDLNNPPKGTWIRHEMNQIVIGATTRSPIAFFLVPFMVVWSGGSIGGIYGSQIIKGEFDPFMSLFGIPFLIGSVIFWSLALMAIWGKVELSLDKHGGKVFTGLGSIGLAKKFTWDEISTVSEKQNALNYPGSRGSSILLEGKRRISFGKGVNNGRRYYLYRALKEILTKVKANKNFV
ncbi:hypothetical protein GCM10027429_25360 [Marivirga atlantica]|jgi:hypothetical protein|uniref:Uncharacterized protein n=1 Tax=Marivirga atlantica TaxID=1548457 RepID=A0A937ABZ0_9BACT|nr:hypothetical protein [Marivirga atlantica]MBL0766136.1 hypothetical protein [Marivirga atlantica]